jgi:hypothetical protein
MTERIVQCRNCGKWKITRALWKTPCKCGFSINMDNCKMKEAETVLEAIGIMDAQNAKYLNKSLAK